MDGADVRKRLCFLDGREWAGHCEAISESLLPQGFQGNEALPTCPILGTSQISEVIQAGSTNPHGLRSCGGKSELGAALGTGNQD